ncbi:hypothetical protein [Candidatus Lariskella endosymbiont of Hedychridium roseum]
MSHLKECHFYTDDWEAFSKIFQTISRTALIYLYVKTLGLFNKSSNG